MTTRIIDKAVIVESESGEFRVVAKSDNNESIMWSEGYTDLEWARQVAAELGVPVTESLRSE